MISEISTFGQTIRLLGRREFVVSTCCCVPLGFLAASNVSAGGGGGGGVTDFQAADFNSAGTATFTMNVDRVNLIWLFCCATGFSGTNPNIYPGASGWTVTAGAGGTTAATKFNGDFNPQPGGSIVFTRNTTPQQGGRIAQYYFAPQISTAGSTIQLNITVSGATANHTAYLATFGDLGYAATSNHVGNAAGGNFASAQTTKNFDLRFDNYLYSAVSVDFFATIIWQTAQLSNALVSAYTDLSGTTLPDDFSGRVTRKGRVVALTELKKDWTTGFSSSYTHFTNFSTAFTSVHVSENAIGFQGF